MNIAFCYENVVPTRGGCETYIADLSRRLIADQHEVHLYASRWDASTLPEEMHFHLIQPIKSTRLLRPWQFGRQCLKALAERHHDVTVGFDKTWGQDVLYPQGGLHVATAEHNLLKFYRPWVRRAAGLLKLLDPVMFSYQKLERLQYLRNDPIIVVNSFMVREHFQRYYKIPPERVNVVRSAIDPERFPEHDRLRRRQEWRERWQLAPQEVVGLLGAMNYRLKGLEPLLYAVRNLRTRSEFGSRVDQFRLVVAGNPNYSHYQQLARQLGIESMVRFVGHCAEMRNAYFASDFLVHPTFYDPCSLVVLEALACGLPIITTRYNGASELMHPLQEGFIIDDPHDANHLAGCLGQLLDPVRRQACASASRRTASLWTFEHHYSQLLDVFEEASQRKHAA